MIEKLLIILNFLEEWFSRREIVGFEVAFSEHEQHVRRMQLSLFMIPREPVDNLSKPAGVEVESCHCFIEILGIYLMLRNDVQGFLILVCRQ